MTPLSTRTTVPRKTFEEWREWGDEFTLTARRTDIIDSLADMGIQADMLNAVRLALAAGADTETIRKAAWGED